MKTIILDFNGTILDDVNLSLKCINYLIEKYLDKDPISLETYRNIFGFPVKDYYEKVGFDFKKDNWFEVAKVWMDFYESHFDEAKIYDGIISFLVENKKRGYRNVVLSASENLMLKKQLEKLKLTQYFDEVLGIDDIYATSKVEVAKKFMARQKEGEYIMLGDTLHDYEVAKELNIPCILISNGHQAHSVLMQSNCVVKRSIKEVKI